MDYMQRSRNVPEGYSDPRRVKWNTEPKEVGFYHDEDGEPTDAYLEPEQELNFNG